MSWFINQFVNAVLQLTIGVIILIAGALVTPLGFTPDVIDAYFPSITMVSDAFKALALCILFVIVLFQLVKIIFGDFAYSKKDEPVSLFLRAGIAIVLILYSMSAMSYLFNAFAEPFYVLTDNNSRQKVFDVMGDEENVFKNSLDESFDMFLESAERTSENTYEDAADRISDWLFPGISILKGLVELICIGVLGYKLILFLLEILERYLILMFQAYTSPLIWPTVASQSTIGIFKKWSEMLISNFLILYLDFWLLGLIVDSMGYIFNPNINITIGNFKPNLILGVAVVYAMIRIAQMLGVYLQRLFSGTGSKASLGQEFLMAFMMVENSIKSLFRGGKHAVDAAGSVGETYFDRSGPDGIEGGIKPQDPKDPDSGGSGSVHKGETYRDYREGERMESSNLLQQSDERRQSDSYAENNIDPEQDGLLAENIPEFSEEDQLDPELTQRIEAMPLASVLEAKDPEQSGMSLADRDITNREGFIPAAREYQDALNESYKDIGERLNTLPNSGLTHLSYSQRESLEAQAQDALYRNQELDQLGVEGEIPAEVFAERAGLDDRELSERLGDENNLESVNLIREPDGVLTAYEDGREDPVGILYPVPENTSSNQDQEMEGNVIHSATGESYYVNTFGENSIQGVSQTGHSEGRSGSYPVLTDTNSVRSSKEIKQLSASTPEHMDSIAIDIDRLNRLLGEKGESSEKPLLLREGGGRSLEANSERPEKVPVLVDKTAKDRHEAAFYE